MAKMGVYCLICEEDKAIYIGSSSYDVKKRHSNHLALLRKNKHYNEELQNIYNTRGEDAVKFVIIEECKEDEIAKAEQSWINYYEEKDWDVVNEQSVFKNRGRLSNEVKQKLSQIQSGSGNGNAKLSEADVDNIRKLIKEGLKNKDIAEKYNVSPSLIEKIKYGVRWKHVG